MPYTCIWLRSFELICIAATIIRASCHFISNLQHFGILFNCGVMQLLLFNRNSNSIQYNRNVFLNSTGLSVPVTVSSTVYVLSTSLLLFQLSSPLIVHPFFSFSQGERWRAVTTGRGERRERRERRYTIGD